MKKFIVSFLIFGMFLVLSPSSVKAVTVTDLYVQIQTLQKQITNLQSQMSALALRAEVPTLSVVNQAPLSVAGPETSKDVSPVKTITPTPIPTLTTIPAIETALPISKLFTDKDIKSTDVNTAVKNINVATDTKKINTEKIINTITKMTLGSKGSDVLALQKILIKKGLLKKELATGYYGTATLAAVSSFQKANGLGVDGVAGKGTIAKLNSLTENLTTNPCDDLPVDIYGNVSTAPFIKVLSPNGGEVYQPGQQITVKWQSCNVPANTQIDLYFDNYASTPGMGGTGGGAISTNDGIETFNLPTTAIFSTMEYGNKFKLRANIGNTILDTSDNMFTISPATQPIASITVTSPNGGQTYTSGQQITATWSTQGIPSSSQICVSLNNYTTAPNMGGSSGLATSLVNDGTETFNLPTISSWPYMDFGNKFKVYAYPCNNPNIMDESDNLFTIANPSSIYVADVGNSRIQEYSINGTFVNQWGTQGSGNGQFNLPLHLAVDSNHNVYVSDYSNNRIQKFTSNGTYITQWGTYGIGNGQFRFPHEVRIDSSNNIYVSDNANYRIQKFDSNGNYITQWGSYGYGNGQFNEVTGLALDSSNNIYTCENGSNRIQKFTSNGTYLTQWSIQGPGILGHYCSGIAVDSSGNVYASDANGNVQKFDSSGNYISQFTGIQGTTGHLAFDLLGNIYASVNFNFIKKYNTSGTFISQWGAYGSGIGQLNQPGGIAIVN